MPTFSIHEARTHLSRLIARAEAGEEVVITRDGKPVVRMEPVRPSRHVEPRAPGSWQGRITIDDSFFDPLPEEELAAWEGEAR